MSKHINHIWVDLLNKILTNGGFVKPRGAETLELIGNQSIISMRYPQMTIAERKLSHSFMFAEAYWILSGRNDVEYIQQFAPSISKYSDNGFTFNGAYGPQIIKQMDYVVDALANDSNTRQAVIQIWDKNPNKSKDVPCTLSLQFIVRKRNGVKTIDCVASMRSSDAWIGFIYDVFNFACLSAYVAMRFNKTYCEGHPGSRIEEVGNLYLTAGSQHLYSNTYEKAKRINAIDAVSPVGALDLNHCIAHFSSCPENFIRSLESNAKDFKNIEQE